MIQSHKVGENRYVVSENGIWVPGIYASSNAALAAAAGLKDDDIITFLEHIYAHDGEDRPVTMDEVETAIAAAKAADQWNEKMEDVMKNDS